MTRTVRHQIGPLEICQISCRDDNYAMLVHHDKARDTVLVEACEAAPILQAIQETGWTPSSLWITHTHHDHIAGLEEIRQATGATIYGPSYAARADALFDVRLQEGESVTVGTAEFAVWHTPGHCPDHLCYVCQDPAVAFVGDVLFSLGCGRLVNGRAEELWQSLQRLLTLSDDTMLYCGHDYTLANGRFALHVDPDNQDLSGIMKEAAQLRAQGEPTLPTLLAKEKACNPFFRADKPALRAAAGADSATPASEVFKALRIMKDRF
jgi:hydroxyacylglutathione hydrolase